MERTVWQQEGMVMKKHSTRRHPIHERVDKLYSLKEHLVHLDEIAGELDPESNARIDAHRKELKQQIINLESEFIFDKASV